MSSLEAYYFAAFAIILTHSTITLVKGQCTVQGCENGDPSMSIVAEIQQLRVDLFDHVNKQVQNIHEHLSASFQQMTSQFDAVTRSLQTVDRRLLQEHDIYIKQGHRIHELFNDSYQQMTSQHDTVLTSLQAVEQRSQEHDICIKQGQSIHELLNESFQQMTSQHGSVMTSLQTVDRRLLQEHDIYIKQGQSIHELLNESLQEMTSQHGSVMTNLQTVDRRLEEHDISIKNQSDQRSQEHDICIKQGQSIHELLNESLQEMKSQHGSVMTNLQTVDRRLEEHDISIKNQSRKAWRLANGICSPAPGVCDCSEIKASGQTTSGVYEVCVGSQPDRICTDAFCDLDTNSGASLVFQRRKDGSVNFNRTWADYRQGFGNRNGEFWLGNEMLYLLTSRRNYTLRVDLEDFTGAKRYAEYTTFSISSSTYNYTLTVSGYSGNAGDSLSNSNRKQFSTDDVNNDNCGSTNCARTHGGAWWHSCCSYATLNGKYYHRYDTVNYRTGIHWIHWHNGMDISLKATEMKLVPVA